LFGFAGFPWRVYASWLAAVVGIAHGADRN
jgi:hypothetical protein